MRPIVNPWSPLVGNVVENVLPSALVFSDEAAHSTKLDAHGHTHAASTMRERFTSLATCTPTPSKASSRS